MISRSQHRARVHRLLERNRVVALLGARQVGKTTLARELARAWKTPAHFFDLEDPRDLARLADPMLALGRLRGLIVLDEIQRRPELFPILRVLADRPRPAKVLVLGSASGDLLHQSSESLAGRIAYHELPPLSLSEVGTASLDRLWLRGGMPRSFAARTLADSAQWRRDFVRTFLERDIPQLGVRVASGSLLRFWTMLAHWHGQTMNWSELGRAMGVTDHTVRAYLELLEETFMVRLLPPWHENLAKRQVKAPKAYLRDSGLLHTLLDIGDLRQLERHPKVGASWEGLCLDTLIQHLGARRDECFFWGLHSGPELDLLVVRGTQRRAFEIKRTTTPSVTPSMRAAVGALGLRSLDVVHAGEGTFPLAQGIRAVSIEDVLTEIAPLRA
jgi:predicted AAA+ superfamily ATPase